MIGASEELRGSKKDQELDGGPTSPGRSRQIGGDVDKITTALAKPKRRGRRRDKAPALPSRDALTSGGVVVAARLAGIEADAFDELRSRLGYRSRGAALRALVRASTGILELRDHEAIEFVELRREIALVGGNINQMSRLAQVGKLEIEQPDRALLQGLERAMIQLRLYLNDVVNERRRRNIHLFQEFLEAEHGR